MNLTGRTLLVTGAGGGLGQSLVRYCLRNNAEKVYCCARDTAKLEELKKTHHAIEVCRLDITDTAEVRALADAIKTIDILINNAGINSGKRVFDPSFADFEVNVSGTLNVCRELSPKISPNGAIVTISSILALTNFPLMGLYSASKSALHSLTQAMRAELAHRGIEVYEVLPGPIDTDMTKDLPMPKSSPETVAEMIFKGIEGKSYEIYPDPFSQTIRAALLNDPASIEADFARSVQE